MKALTGVSIWLLVLLLGCGESMTGPPKSGVPVRLSITPASAFLRPGAVMQTQLSAWDSEGLPSAVTEVTYQTSDSRIVSVSPTGEISAGVVGTATITAKSGRLSAMLEVMVVVGPPRAEGWALWGPSVLTQVSLLGAWMADDGNGWMVGQDGTVLRTHDGGAHWEQEAIDTDESLVSVWGSGSNDVYAVGTGGAVWRYDGTEWVSQETPTSETLLTVWGLGPGQVFAAGVNVILSLGSDGWEIMPAPAPFELWGIWGTSVTNLHAVGQNGVILRWDGVSWRKVPSPFPELLLGIWGTSESNIWAVGIQGALLRWNGNSWTKETSPTTGSLFAIWGRSATEIWAAGNNGLLLRWNGSAWTLVPQRATGQNLRAIAGTSSPGGPVVAAGWNGAVIQRPSPAHPWLAGPAAPALLAQTNRFVVGTAGSILRLSEPGEVALEPVMTHRDLFGIADLGNGEEVVVGDSGAVLKKIAGNWESLPAVTTKLLRAVWAPDQGGDAVIVGEGGTILRLRGLQLQAEASGTDRFLRAVWGLAPNLVFAVGDQGTLLRFDGSGWRREAVPTELGLRAVWGSGPNDIFAAGDDGVVLRFDGTKWYLMTVPISVEWRGLWGTGPNDVYLVGDEGSLLHFDGTSWNILPLPTTELLLSVGRGLAPGSVRITGAAGGIFQGVR